MSGLCGWIGAAGGWPEPSLAAMAARLPTPEGKMASAVAGKAALAAPEGQFARDGMLLAGYAGRLRWRTGALADLAREKGNAHALLEAWRRHGPALMEHVAGHWSLAVLDGESGRGIVAVDRAGTHPVAYASTGTGTAFASGVQALRVLDGVDDDISMQAILTYLVYFVMPAPESIYSGIRKLMPLECLDFGPHGASVKPYRSMVYAERTTERLEDLCEALRAHMSAAVERAMDGLEEGRTGAFLSGGLDSSSVTAYMARRSGAPMKTFTIGFDEPGYDESGYARVVADAFKTDHTEYFVTPKDVAALIPRLPGAYDEPFGNSSAAPAYYCAKAAQEAGITTMLAGDGGDELFAGNERYISVLAYAWYDRLPRLLRKGLIEPVSRLPGFGHLPMGRRVKGLVRYANIPLPDRIYAYDFFTREPLEEVFDQDRLALVDRERAFDLVRASYRAPGTGSDIQRMMHMDVSITLADNDLRKVNRMTALAGVDVRYPMLDDDLIDFAATLPAEVLLLDGRLRGFFKKGMTGILPEAVVNKTKHGFGLPFSRWLKTDSGLKELVDSTLRDFQKRGIFRRSFIERVMQSRQEPGETILDRFTWDIMILELWLQHWQDAAAAQRPAPAMGAQRAGER